MSNDPTQTEIAARLEALEGLVLALAMFAETKVEGFGKPVTELLRMNVAAAVRNGAPDAERAAHERLLEIARQLGIG